MPLGRTGCRLAVGGSAAERDEEAWGKSVFGAVSWGRYSAQSRSSLFMEGKDE